VAFGVRGEADEESAAVFSGWLGGVGNFVLIVIPGGKNRAIAGEDGFGVMEMQRLWAGVAQKDFDEEAGGSLAEFGGGYDGNAARDGEGWAEGVVVAGEADAEALRRGEGGGFVDADEAVLVAVDFDGGLVRAAEGNLTLIHATPGALAGEELQSAAGVGKEGDAVVAEEEIWVVGEHGRVVVDGAGGKAQRAGVVVRGKAEVVVDPLAEWRCGGSGERGWHECAGGEGSGGGEEVAAGEKVICGGHGESPVGCMGSRCVLFVSSGPLATGRIGRRRKGLR
jgi:hypothetical protein